MEVEQATDTKEDKGSTGEEGKCFLRLLVSLSAALFYRVTTYHKQNIMYFSSYRWRIHRRERGDQSHYLVGSCTRAKTTAIEC